MNNLIVKLLNKGENLEDKDSREHALLSLGLLVERHTQNRYNEQDYLHLLGNDMDLFNIKLTELEVNEIHSFFIQQLKAQNPSSVTLTWGLGKCYGKSHLQELLEIISLYDRQDEVCQQVLFSATGLLAKDQYIKLINQTTLILEGKNMPLTRQIIQDHCSNV